MYHITFSFVSWLIIGKALYVDGLSNALKEYDSKVCKNEPSCHLSNQQNLPNTRRTLEGRDCMCDFECVEYSDCCKDSEFYGAATASGNSYVCSSSSQIYILASCPEGYPDQTVVSKCLASGQPLEGSDTSLIRPATNPKRRITYGNAYCALCNNDLNDVLLWNLSARCGEAPGEYFEARNQFPETSEKYNEIHIPTKNVKPPLPYSFGGNQAFQIPSFGGNTFKSSYNTNFFRRHKREDTGIDFNKYQNKLNDVLKNVQYDFNTGRFLSQYKGKSLVCEFSTSLPRDFDLYVRKCVADMVSSCPPNYSDQETAEKCSLETAIVYEKASKKAYKNRDCAKCNDVPEISLTGCPQKERTGASSLFSTVDKGASPPCDTPELKKKFC